jgi:hypothetical protein
MNNQKYFILIIFLILPIYSQVSKKFNDHLKRYNVKYHYTESFNETNNPGTLTGYTIEISFDHKMSIYKNYVGRPFELKKVFRLYKSTIDSLDSLCQLYRFNEFPERLPIIGKNIPSTFRVTIASRTTPNDSTKIVYAQMDADRKYYPKGFDEIMRKFRGLLSKYLSHVD